MNSTLKPKQRAPAPTPPPAAPEVARFSSATKEMPAADRPAPVPLSDAQFWIVWRLDALRPSQRHPSLEVALRERERLQAHFRTASF
jgi:hypothetical protein